MSKGFIQLDREVFESGIFRNKEPFSKREAWIDILIMVNYKDSKIVVGNTLIECKAGQSILSQESWAKRWNWDRSQVRRYFELLQKVGMIQVENVQKTTRITVLSCNEIAQDLHQSCNEIAPKTTDLTPLKSDSCDQVQPDSDPSMTNERPFVDPSMTTIEEGNKEIKKESNNTSSSITPENEKKEEEVEEIEIKPEQPEIKGFDLAGKELKEFNETVNQSILNPKVDKNQTLESLRTDLDLVNQVLRELRNNSIDTKYFCLTENDTYKPTQTFHDWYIGLVEECILRAHNAGNFPRKLGDTRSHVINTLRKKDFIQIKKHLMPQVAYAPVYEDPFD